VNVGQRIRQLRKAKGMTISAMAHAIGGDVGNLSRLERGQQGYSDASIKKIAEALGVTIAQLFSEDEDSDTVHKYSVESLIPTRRDDVYRVEVLDVSASAGSGATTHEVMEVIRSIEYVPEQARLIFGNRPEGSVKLINVRGDSMQGTIEPGDLIFVDISVCTFDGDGIYVFDFNGDTYVKRLQKVKYELLVISDNDRYREWSISPDEIDMLHVSGRVMLSQSQQLRRHG